jgi:imidazole glycerol phosphate synthase subunit HisF
VLVDKDVHIRGFDLALITYIGTECGNPMLTSPRAGRFQN